VDKTAADDVQLLERFKSMHAALPGPIPNFDLPNFTGDVDMLAGFDLDIGDADLGMGLLPPASDPSLAAA
jgi:hypothetical protein